MKITDQADWDKGIKNNTDLYGARCYSYAKDWADLMEAEIDKGKTVAEVAKETSHTADHDGIAGFMYGCAVNILSRAWEHGEELRKWHNLDVQIGNEGEKANESGGTLNPAILGLGKDEDKKQ